MYLLNQSAWGCNLDNLTHGIPSPWMILHGVTTGSEKADTTGHSRKPSRGSFISITSISRGGIWDCITVCASPVIARSCPNSMVEATPGAGPRTVGSLDWMECGQNSAASFQLGVREEMHGVLLTGPETRPTASTNTTMVSSTFHVFPVSNSSSAWQSPFPDL